MIFSWENANFRLKRWIFVQIDEFSSIFISFRFNKSVFVSINQSHAAELQQQQQPRIFDPVTPNVRRDGIRRSSLPPMKIYAKSNPKSLFSTPIVNIYVFVYLLIFMYKFSIDINVSFFCRYSVDMGIIFGFYVLLSRQMLWNSCIFIWFL